MEGFVFVLFVFLICHEMSFIMAPVQDWSDVKLEALHILKFAPAYTNASELIPCVQHTTVKYYGYVDKSTRAFYSSRPWLSNTLYITPLAEPDADLILERCIVNQWGESSDVRFFLNRFYFFGGLGEHMQLPEWRERESPEVSTRATTIQGPSSLLRGKGT